MCMPECIDYEGLKGFLDDLFGAGPEIYKLLPPRGNKVPVNGLIIFDSKKRLSLKYPPLKPVIFELLRHEIIEWVIGHKDEFPHLIKRLENMCGILDEEE